MCTTEEPGKPAGPCPSPNCAPSCDNQPPPHTQFPKIGYANIDMKKQYTTNEPHFQRSANAPVGMVTAVSMKTIANMNKVKTPTSYESPRRKSPFCPKMFSV